MATPYSDLITAAIASSLANDGGTTDVASNTSELTGVLSRRVRQVYTWAALPPSDRGWQRGNYFTTTGTVTIGTPASTYVALPTSPEPAFIPQILDSGNAIVSVVTLRDVAESVAEIPPAVIITNGKLTSAGRTGDPVAGDVLTLQYAYLPPETTTPNDYVGATTSNDATTTDWPGHVGNPYLIAWLAWYLGIKDGTRDPAELQYQEQRVQEAAQLLGTVIGVAPARLAQVREG